MKNIYLVPITLSVFLRILLGKLFQFENYLTSKIEDVLLEIDSRRNVPDPVERLNVLQRRFLKVDKESILYDGFECVAYRKGIEKLNESIHRLDAACSLTSYEKSFLDRHLFHYYFGIARISLIYGIITKTLDEEEIRREDSVHSYLLHTAPVYAGRLARHEEQLELVEAIRRSSGSDRPVFDEEMDELIEEAGLLDRKRGDSHW